MVVNFRAAIAAGWVKKDADFVASTQVASGT